MTLKAWVVCVVFVIFHVDLNRKGKQKVNPQWVHFSQLKVKPRSFPPTSAGPWSILGPISHCRALLAPGGNRNGHIVVNINRCCGAAASISRLQQILCITANIHLHTEQTAILSDGILVGLFHHAPTVYLVPGCIPRSNNCQCWCG